MRHQRTSQLRFQLLTEAPTGRAFELPKGHTWKLHNLLTHTLELPREVAELRVQLSSTTFEYNWQIAIQGAKRGNLVWVTRQLPGQWPRRGRAGTVAPRHRGRLRWPETPGPAPAPLL